MAEVCGGAEGALTESLGLQPNSIPDNKSNRECILVSCLNCEVKGEGFAEAMRRDWRFARSLPIRMRAFLNDWGGGGDCVPSLDLGELVGGCRIRLERSSTSRSAGRT
jgi:hypothetical protein